jgi:hypothetical protein
MLFAGPGTLAQPVRPGLDGFTAVDLVLAAERSGLPGTVHLQVQEYPSGRVLREAQVPAATLRAGSAWNVRPGSPGERWSTFGFDPIPESAEKEYLLVLSYPPPDGVDQPGARVAALARFPNNYGPGQLSINGSPAGGVLLLRLAAAGTHGQAVQVGLTNLARAQPLGTGSLLAPTVAAALAVCFATTLAVAMAGLPGSGQ